MTLRISARLAEHANARHDSHRASPAASMGKPLAVSAVVMAVSTGGAPGWLSGLFTTRIETSLGVEPGHTACQSHR